MQTYYEVLTVLYLAFYKNNRPFSSSLLTQCLLRCYPDFFETKEDRYGKKYPAPKRGLIETFHVIEHEGIIEEVPFSDAPKLNTEKLEERIQSLTKSKSDHN